MYISSIKRRLTFSSAEIQSIVSKFDRLLVCSHNIGLNDRLSMVDLLRYDRDSELNHTQEVKEN